MKKDTHPTYHANAQFSCECGNVVTAGSTLETYKVEICSKCHPFYTGKQKLVDTAGRVEKFNAKRKKADEKTEDPKISENAKKGKKDEKYMNIEDMKSLKEKEEKKSAKKAPAKKATEKKAAAKKPKADESTE